MNKDTKAKDIAKLTSTESTDIENNNIDDYTPLNKGQVHSNDLQSKDEIDYDLVCSGPLYFDPRHVKPGYVPCFVANEGGNVETYKKYGYEVVIDEFKVGKEYASTTSKFSSAVTIQSKCGTLLVLMVISEENYKRFQAHKDKKSRERTAGLGHISGIPAEYQQEMGHALGEYKVTRK